MRSRHGVVAVLVTLLGVFSFGCAPWDGVAGGRPGDSAGAREGAMGQAAADCALAVRFDGTEYVEHGFTDHSATRLGQGEDSQCDDMGVDPRGSYFAEDSRKVDVWSFDGQDPREVLGVRESTGRLRAFIARGVGTAKADAIVEALGQSSARHER